MMHIAVNCLVNEARRKLVCESMRCLVRRSVTPYPWRKNGMPSCTTSTDTPGASLDFNDAKTASICADETWAGDFPISRSDRTSEATNLICKRQVLRVEP